VRTALSLGAASALHVLACALLPAWHGAERARLVPVEVQTVAQPQPAPALEPAPEPVAAPPPARRHRGGHRAAKKVAVPVPESVPVSASESESVPVPIPAPAPAGEGSGTGTAAGTGTGSATGTGATTGTAAGSGAGPAPPVGPSKAAAVAPVEDYTRLVPPYSDDAIDHDVTGAVALRLEIDAEGRVTRATVLKGRGYGLDELAVETARRYRFHPALDDAGRPIPSVIGWRIVWESYWKRLFVQTVAGHPNCAGHGPLNLGEYHPVYMDCEAPPGAFVLGAEELRRSP
jgi:TonB family protein